jgi:hypothetical protein
LEAMAEVAQEAGDAMRTARLLGAAAAQRARIGLARPVLNQAAFDRYVARTRVARGAPAFTAAWEDGGALSMPAALALVLGEPPP